MAKRRTEAPPKLDHIDPSLHPLAVPIDSLTLDPANARIHDEAQLRALAASVIQFTQMKPVVVQRRPAPDGERLIVRCGNGLVTALQRAGMTHVAAVVKEMDDREATAYALTDNRTSDMSYFDHAVIEQLSQEFNLEEFASSLPDLNAVLAGLKDLDEEIGAGGELGDEDPEPAPERKKREPARGQRGSGPAVGFFIQVTCTDEAEQTKLLEEFLGRGLDCRALS